MKSIIAPIDFSDVSQNALWFAAELSKRTAARLIVVHATQEESEDISKQLEHTISNLQNFIGEDFPCESVMLQGNLVNSLKGLIGLHQPDLIVMGTKGAGGLKKILIGSNTVRVIANVQVPVLVIPEMAKFENFHNAGKNRVVLATDLDELENDDALDILKEITLLFNQPKVRVISVRPKSQDLDDEKRIEREALVSRFRPEIPSEWYTVFSSSVLEGINNYLNRNVDTGLVAMIARDSRNIFDKHFTREMASHTEYPLLVMHDE